MPRQPIRRLSTSIVKLESRETPALFVNSTTLTYQDVDGDTVTVRFSRPILTSANAPTVFTFNNAFTTTTGQQLQSINLTSLTTTAGGTTISTSAVRSPVNGGDGFAALGQIDATGIDLGAVNIDGDLGRIVAGNSTTTTPGLASLTVASLGRFGTTTGATNLITFVQGRLGTLTVKGDMKEAFIDVEGGADGDIGTVTIFGSLIGGAVDDMGRIEATGDIGFVTVKGSLIGADGDDSGAVEAAGKLAGVTVGGDLVGSSGFGSGQIRSSGAMGAIKITGNVIGSTGSGSGRIFANTTLGSIYIGGNLQGGSNLNSGLIYASDSLAGTVRINGDVIGGDGSTSGAINADALTSITIGGDLIGGNGGNSGQIRAFGDLGTVKIVGDVIGGVGGTSGQIATNTALTSLTIGGDVLGGSGSDTGMISAFTLGTLKITGNLIGGSASGAVNLSRSGYVRAGRISTLTIGGSLIAGTDNTTGIFVNNGAIRVRDDIGSLTIGNIIGNSTNPAFIGARGKVTPTVTSDLAFGSVRVLGRVEYAQIIAGEIEPSYSSSSVRNADAQIGAVSVGGDWIASSLIAGAVAGTDLLFGTTDDAKITGGTVKNVATVSSRITSLTITGQAYGTVGGSDHFGIVAENVGIVKIGGTTIPTIIGNGNDDFFISITNDFKINEVA